MSCGSRAVGDPLVAPTYLLPSYGRAFFALIFSILLTVAFLVITAAALFDRDTFALDLGTLIAAAQTAAWRLKWTVLPVSVLAVIGSIAICKTIRANPRKLAGLRMARSGLAMSLFVTATFVSFIGVTVPERLRQRQSGLDAAVLAQFYTIHRAQQQYRNLYGTLPADLSDLKEVPDQDGSIAEAILGINPSGYRVWSIQARLPEKTSRKRPGIGPASLDASTDDVPDEGLSFTNYELRLPGRDKIIGTDDDWVVRDGVVFRPMQSPNDVSPASSSPGMLSP